MQSKQREPSPARSARAVERRWGDLYLHRRSGFVLPVVASLLLALCAWLLFRPGEPRPGTPAGILGATSAGMALDEHGHELECQSQRTEQLQRASIDEIAQSRAAPAPASIAQPVTCVSGWIVDAAHQPISGARSVRVRCVDRLGRQRVADADAAGEYALRALAFGTQWVSISADGYRSESVLIELRPDHPRTRLDFTLQKAVEVRVKLVTPDGRSVLEVLTQLGARDAARSLVPVVTRAPLVLRLDGAMASSSNELAGRFEKSGPLAPAQSADCIGVVRLDADPPAWTSLVRHQRVLQTKRIDVGQDEVIFVLAPDDLLTRSASIRLHVFDAVTKLPLIRARIMLSDDSGFATAVTSDAQGLAVIDAHATSVYQLRVQSKRYQVVELQLTALATGVTDLGTITLEPETAVTGRVRNTAGAPLAASFSLGILDPLDHSVRWLNHAGFKSRGDGSFLIVGLGRAEYVIRTCERDPGIDSDWKGIAAVSDNVIVDTRAGSISDLDVRLQAAAKLVLRAADVNAGPISFRALDERGLECAHGTLHGSEPRALELPPGTYRLELLGPQRTVLAERMVSLGSETVMLDFTP